MTKIYLSYKMTRGGVLVKETKMLEHIPEEFRLTKGDFYIDDPAAVIFDLVVLNKMRLIGMSRFNNTDIFIHLDDAVECYTAFLDKHPNKEAAKNTGILIRSFSVDTEKTFDKVMKKAQFIYDNTEDTPNRKVYLRPHGKLGLEFITGRE